MGSLFEYIRKGCWQRKSHSLGKVLREVAKSGGPIYVERDGKPVAVILSIHEYERIRRGAKAEKSGLLTNSFGLWSKRAEIDEAWVAEGRSRWESEWPK